jgi:hypothetical protein
MQIMNVTDDEVNPVDTMRSPARHGARWRRWLRFPRTWKEVRSLGWKAIVGFLLFYLIRDAILYLLLPYLIVKGIISL